MVAKISFIVQLRHKLNNDWKFDEVGKWAQPVSKEAQSSKYNGSCQMTCILQNRIWEKPTSPAFWKEAFDFSAPPPPHPYKFYLRVPLSYLKSLVYFFELNSYIFQGRPTLTASEEFLKNLDSEIKNLKIVEVETSTRFKFSKLSRSRLARDSNFQNCRDRDLCETHNLWIVEIEIWSRPQFSGLSRLRFVETGQKLSRSRFFQDSRWSHFKSMYLTFRLLSSNPE